MAWSLAALASSLLVLALGAELLVRGSVGLAARLGVSSFFIGLTIVGFGTSTPELFTSLLAGLRGLDDIAVGNVVGSNTFNVAFTLGLTACIRPVVLKMHLVRSEVWIVIAVSLAPFVSLLTGGVLGRPIGALLLLALGLYLWRGWRIGRGEFAAAPAPAARPGRRAWIDVALVLAGLATLVGGSHLLIEAATALARELGLSELVIGLTVVAAGTSAPELITSVVAALRREADIAVGNVLGSNVFNLLGILGLTCLVEPQQVKAQVVALDAPVMLAASAALLPIAARHGRIPRFEGALLWLGYAGYVAVLIELAPRWFAPS